MLATSELRKVRARNLVFKEGTPALHLHIVLSGSIELFGRSGGKEAVIAVMSPGDPFIMAAVVKNAPALMSARAIENSELLCIPAETFRWAMNNDPVLAVRTSMELGTSFRAMVKQLRDHKLRTSKQRLAAYLSRLARAQKGARTIELPVNKRLLSSLLGIEPASLSRAFAELRAYGVETHGQTVTVVEPSKLEQLASCDWSIDDTCD